jgi:hypothetical protein
MKGLSNSVVAIVVAAALIVGAGIAGYFFTQQQAQVQPTQPTDFDGSFATYQPLQEVTGYNDLSVTAESLSDTNTVVDDGNAVAKYNLNTSDGQNIRFAFGVEIDGPMEEIDAQVTNEGVESALDVQSVRMVEDEDDENSIDEAPVVREFSVDSDDEVDGTVSNVQEGEYAFVIEVRGTDTSTISTDQDLYTVELDANTDADSDEAEEMSVTIDNASP